MSDARTPLTRARRVVVKIGSRALAREPEAAGRLAAEVASLSSSQRSFVIVSSGAIAIGCERLGYRTKPKDVAKLQAAAATGQSVLMRRYDEALGGAGLIAAQVLLTHGDLSDRERLNNARQALGALLDAHAVPIVNENDTVATEEIRFGDNDQLAAMVVPLVGAELLVLMTDVEGVLDARGRRICVMTGQTEIAVLGHKDAVGSGGMKSKLDAARKASRSGAAVVIASSERPNALTDILKGKDVGTLFPATERALRARKHWIAFTLRPRGDVLLDPGAVRAVISGRSSLLPVGVLGVRGQFNPGDAVRLVAADGTEVGRGLARISSIEVALSAGKKGADLELVFGPRGSDLVIVHKDDLVTDPRPTEVATS